MDTEEKLALALEALRRIASFGHTEDCVSTGAPVHECGCYELDEREIAATTLINLGE